jgi:hypothetical protein
VKWNKIVEHHEIKTDNLAQTNVSLKEEKKPKTDKKLQLKINKVRAKTRFNLHLAHQPSDEMDLLISAVNAADLGWKADICKYQKTNPSYGKHCEEEEALLLQTSEKDDDESKQSLE